jgi:hypothetical protein
VTANSLGQYIFEGRVAGNYANPNASTKCLNETNPTINCADYITINIPSGFAISGINLDFYDAVDERAFIAFQGGNQFTAGFTGTGLLAYNHFGWRGLCATNYGSLRPSANASNNCIDASNTTPVTSSTTSNLLTNVYTASPASPVPGNLGSGDYTFLIQQISGDSSYQFTVQSAQVPGPLPVIGAAAAFGWSRRLRLRLRARSLG